MPITRALQRAHELGLVHRDLKPGNIFLAREGDNEVPKILDFGVAKTLLIDDRKQSEVTHEGIVLGTPHYMSPEQALNHQIDARSDLWSLGVILFRALTGKRPFEGGAALETVVAICTARIPKATEANPELPPEIDAFFSRALARDRTERFQSAREMSQAFAQRFRGPNTSWPPPAPAAPPADSPPAEYASTAEIQVAAEVPETKLDDRVSAPETQLDERVSAPEIKLDDRVSARRKRLTIGVAVLISSLVAAIAVARIFGGSEAEPAKRSEAAPLIAPSAAPVQVAAQVSQLQAAPTETAPVPAASASAAPSATQQAHRAEPTRSRSKSTSTSAPDCHENQAQTRTRSRLLIPPARQIGLGSPLLTRVVGDVVEEHQPCARGIAKFEDVQTRGRLIQPVAVAAGVEAEQARDQQAQCGLVRNHEHRVRGVTDDDLAHHRQRAGEHGNARFCAFGGESERVGLPRRVFLRMALLDLERE